MSRVVFFRVDASKRIGGGHVMRCLALADQLLSLGCRCVFVVNDQALETVPALIVAGHEIRIIDKNSVEIPGDIDEASIYAMVFDHYGLDAAAEHAWRRFSQKIVVIDDLANRPHDCDMLLDQNFGVEEVSYRQWTAANSQILTGPNFALLRPQFRRSRASALSRRLIWDGQPRNILLTLGMTDLGGHTARVAKAALSAPGVESLNTVIAVDAPSRPHLEQMAKDDSRIRLYDFVDDIASLMVAADVALGAMGISTWERCALGLPTIGAILADNQCQTATALHAAGAISLIGDLRKLSFKEVCSKIECALSDVAYLKRSGEVSQTFCDGLGATRFAELIVQ